MKFSTTNLPSFMAFAAAAMATTSSVVTGQSIGDDLIQPPFVESDNSGVLDTMMSIDYATHVSAIHTLTDTRLLNGTMPGPTIKIKAGDTLRLRFVNNLVATQFFKCGDDLYGISYQNVVHR